MLTGMWRERVTVQTLQNDPWHPLSGNLTFRARIEFNGMALEPCSISALDNHRPHWENETTASGGDVPTSPKYWIPAGLQLIAIWPADAVGNQNLVVDGVNVTPQLSADGDFIDIGEEELNTILGYALHYLSFKDPRFEETMPLYQAFIEAAVKKNDRLNNSNMYRAVSGLDQERTDNPVLDPSKEPSAT
jgi:hypothetical protein